MQFTNFYMRNGLDEQLLPPDNELKKWSFNASAKQLPWDSTMLFRWSQSELTNNLGIASASLKPTSNASPPRGVGYLVTAPYDAESGQPLSTFDGEHKTTTAHVSWNASPMARLDTRVYYDYYDLQNDSTQRVVRGGQPGQQLRDAPGQQRDVLPDRGAAGRRGVPVHEELGGLRRVLGVHAAIRSSSAASTGRRSSAISIRRRRPTTTATGSSTATAAGRRSPAGSSTSTCSVARTSIPASTTTASPTSSRRPSPTTSRPTTCRTSTRTW